MNAAMSIAELADAAGLTRRAVRFYVQQKLLPAPNGLGRGKHYDPTHLERIRQIRQLQLAGHSLEEIRHLLHTPNPTLTPPASTLPPTPRAPASLIRAELWRRLRITQGLELHFDPTHFNPTLQDLLHLREVITQIMTPPPDDQPPTTDDGQRTTDH